MHENILLIDKPAGWTSFDVVAKIRGNIRQTYREKGEKPTKKQLRVGHAGTLDPFATGLLIILLGEACKQAGDYLKLDKVYEATFMLGITSTTGDPEGEKTVVSSTVPNEQAVTAALKAFEGNIQQTPPAFSAIKINGQRAYKLARKGEEVVMPVRTVSIYSLELVDYSYPLLKVRAHVGSGTYIRSLAEDIGKKLETGAYCSELKRTMIADYDLVSAHSLDDYITSL
jgi:tRNA pseudouridine55 synthase